jgi:hypothetical protein
MYQVIIPTSKNRSPSRFDNFIIKVLALKMELILFSPTEKPKNV